MALIGSAKAQDIAVVGDARVSPRARDVWGRIMDGWLGAGDGVTTTATSRAQVPFFVLSDLALFSFCPILPSLPRHKHIIPNSKKSDKRLSSEPSRSCLVCGAAINRRESFARRWRGPRCCRRRFGGTWRVDPERGRFVSERRSPVRGSQPAIRWTKRGFDHWLRQAAPIFEPFSTLENPRLLRLGGGRGAPRLPREA